MSRSLSWVVNTALLVLCCYLVANTANTVFAALLAPASEDAAPSATASTPTSMSWQQHQAIIDRNLFGSKLVTAALPEIDPLADLEETKLPLKLVGTLATLDPEDADAVATVQDSESKELFTVAIGESLRNGAATVERIERKRIVLRERGELRELSLDEGPEMVAGRPKMPSFPKKPARRPVRKRTAAKPRPPAAQKQMNEAMRRPAEIFAQANMRPKYNSGKIVGVEVSSIKAGSQFEAAGIQNGELITSLNGISIDSPEQSAKLLMELAKAEVWNLTVKDPDGNERNLELDAEK